MRIFYGVFCRSDGSYTLATVQDLLELMCGCPTGSFVVSFCVRVIQLMVSEMLASSESKKNKMFLLSQREKMERIGAHRP